MDAEAYGDLERRLVGRVRSAGPLRAALAQLAHGLTRSSAWERLGYVRLSDYADERVGLSARSLQDLAQVGGKLELLPRLRQALVRGQLGWTKTRLVARVAHYYDEERWIAYADRVTSATLARELRKVDVGSLEGGAVERDRSRSHWLEVPCTLEVRACWFEVQRSARRVHGSRVSPATCLEMVVAEVLSALPIDPDLAPEPELDQGIGARDARALVASASDRDDAVSSPARSGDPLCLRGPSDDACGDVPAESRNDDDGGIGETVVSCDLPPAIEALVRDGEDADAAELDRRLRALVAMERRLEAEIGPLLDVLMRLRVYRTLGYANRDSYIRERLGMEPSRGRALLRIERAARASLTFARAYRQGGLSALQASTLVALVLAELAESKLEAWVEWARGTTLRRLRDAVDLALLLRETDWERWQRTGGLPDSEPGAEGAVQGDVPAERGLGAQHSASEEKHSVGCQLDLEVIRVFRALLCTVQRRLEPELGLGRLPTRGEAFGAMLDHVLGEWGGDGGGDAEQVPRRHAVFARDGWRCVVPGCTSMRNLQDHHIVFRSAGGSDDLANRVTLCAFHHLRGVHGGTVRLTGRAPDHLRIELGVRPDGPPLAVYGSGDRRIA